ncbi:aromatic ring-hydroxylating dioxygenase subunit alpha [Yinghuangia soli]|uniref:Aromatic ring-hydroxylating dioxygenase subunit alpha n=1 Tax=Yinghuangia soli TaxID=2908204 RepID=A0AA41Q6E5_9ACTN|nr:aromatic ring-hydroxylating dioxygenase subunit alpha [Yinghuangia soli]MCF2531546.1 aromatic ring-hydroxylating dioxygenase subunit alpha [Yinghuangia soli]
MFKNFWYAVEFTERVGRTPVQVVCLGQRLVLYRTAAGRVACLSDLCAHRGAALSGGTVVGETIECPYHGWRFGADGGCLRIPANPPGRAIPPKARVDAYPVEERYGFVWVYLGDLPEADRPPIPEWPEFGDLVQDGGTFRAVTGEYLWHSNYERILENGCDIAHTPFVHAGSFGNPERPEVEDYALDETEWSAFATVRLHPPAAKGLWSRLYRTSGSLAERPPVTVSAGWMLPNMIKLHVRLPLGNMIIYDTNIPVDANTTLVKWVALRDFFTGSWADANARKRVLKIFGQDAPVVDAVRPELLPADLGAELHLKSDLVSVAYRRRRRQLADLGWLVGPADTIDGGATGRDAVVIASPGRRNVPELARAWAQKSRDAVPTASPDNESTLTTADFAGKDSA